jgi:hypothetical protein
MRKDILLEHVTLGALSDLDALVGARVMGVTPRVYWQDSYANQRFDTLEEALAAMRDPYFQLFIPERERAEAVLVEVREFPPYSSKIAVALEIVTHFSAAGEALLLRCKNHWWVASIGGHPESRARTAAAAICLAALRVKGFDVELRESAHASPEEAAEAFPLG